MRPWRFSWYLIAWHGLAWLLWLAGAWGSAQRVAQLTPLPAAAQAQWQSEFILWALGGLGLTTLSSIFAVWRWGQPLEKLTHAAQRLGPGATDLPQLAATLEEMRHRFTALTATAQRDQSAANAILLGISEGVFAVDRERRVKYINPQTTQLLGLDAAEAVGRFCGDVLNPVGRPCESHCPILHARFQGRVRATEHLQLVDGQRRTVVITSAAPAPTDTAFQQVQVLRDETELEATRRLRDAVLANISHEFRTPLSAQLASIELLLDQLPTLQPAQTRALVQTLQRGTLRLTQLIDNLLESVRVEAGQSQLRQQSVALAEVVAAAHALLQPLFEQRQQTLKIELPALPPVRGDAPRLTQVFVNLLANANKFAPSESVITVGGRVTPTTVLVWVQDAGPGLPPVSPETLFARWERAGAESTSSGVGLGLWIVKSIVERHRGQVTAQSAHPGARFSLTLPREVNEDFDCG